jgi:hypothetical protein
MASYDQWKMTNPDDERLGPDPDDDDRDEYHKLAEERYERELERQLEALEDRLNEDDPHPPECAWESPY